MKTLFFLTLSLLLATINIVNGQVVYTDASVTLDVLDTNYLVDMNDDGIVDYEINLNSGTSGCPYVSCKSYNNNCIASYNHPEKSNAPQSYQNNSSIDESLLWVSYEYGGLLALSTSCITTFFWGNFRGVVDAFIGLKFTDAYGTYYGWIRVDVSADGDWVTIKDFAYEASGNEIITSTVTNINEIYYTTSDIDIYPNPAHNKINVAIPTDEYNIEVIDLCGKVLLRESNIATIDISKIPAGIYTLRVSHENGNSQKRIIVY
jgi:hypothetical protein